MLYLLLKYGGERTIYSEMYYNNVGRYSTITY